MSAINLAEYKNLKKSKLIVSELRMVLRILNLAVRGLKGFHYYSPVKDLLPHIKDCKTIIEVHYNHHLQLIEKKGESDD